MCFLCMRYALDNIVRHPKKNILCFLSVSTASILLGCVLLMMLYIKQDEKMLDEVLINGIDETEIIIINGDTESSSDINKKKCQFVYEVKDYGLVNELSWIKTNVGLNSNSYEELISRQASNGIDNNGYFSHVLAGENVFDIFEIEFYSKKDLKQIKEQYGEEYSYIYLGYNFRDIPLGTVFVSDNQKEKDVVVGILSEGTQIVNEIVTVEGVYSDVSVIELDDRMIRISEDIGNILFCSVDKNNDEGNIYDELHNIAKENKLNITINNLRTIYDNKYQDDNKLIEEIMKLLKMVIFVVTVLMISIQTTLTMDNLKNYAILKLTGVKSSQVFLICILESIIRVVVSIFLSGAVAMGYIYYTYTDIAAIELARSLLWCNVIPITIAIMLFVSVISLIIPICLIEKKTLAWLIGGMRE